MRRRILIIVAILVIALLLAGVAWAGNYFYGLAFLRGDKAFLTGNPDLGDEDAESRTAAWDENAEWLATQRSQVMEITSDDGLKLVGTYISAPEQGGRTAILVHGYVSNRQAMLGIARVFVEQLGYNVLLPDLRAHGDSEGEVIGFGWTDRLDLLLWIDRVLQQHGPNEQVVLYGVSMGGAAVMMAAGEELPGNVKAIIEDCGYTSAEDELAYQLKQLYGLPSFPLIQSASIVARHRAGFFLGEVSAVEQVRKTRLPILFIHGEDDAFVPYHMVDTLYEAAGGPKEKYTVPGAGHAESYGTLPEQYVQKLHGFLSQYVSE